MVLTGEVERPVVISFTPKQLEPVRLHIFISTIRKIFSIYEVLVALIEQIPGMMRDKMSKVKDPSQWVICEWSFTDLPLALRIPRADIMPDPFADEHNHKAAALFSLELCRHGRSGWRPAGMAQARAESARNSQGPKDTPAAKAAETYPRKWGSSMEHRWSTPG
eukprot:jgi/Tetstr1/422318/TSEL_013161.t1